MSNPEIPSFEELLEAYSDLSVSRDVVGYMTITQDIGPSGVMKISVHDAQYEGEELPRVRIEVLDELKRGETRKTGNEDLVLDIIPEGTEKARVEVSSNKARLNIADVLQTTNEGIELFSAYLARPRGAFSNRIFDELGRDMTERLEKTQGPEATKSLAEVSKRSELKYVYFDKMVRNARAA